MTPQIELTAPYGSVTGSVYLGNASASSDVTLLTSWSFCQARTTQPTPLGPAPASRRSAREEDGEAADGLPFQRLGFALRSAPEEAAAAQAASAELAAAAEAAAAEGGPRALSQMSAAALEEEIARVLGRRSEQQQMPRPKAAATGASAARANNNAASAMRAWPSGLSGLEAALESGVGGAAVAWSNETLGRGGRGRILKGQLSTLLHFDLSGSGRGVTVDGTVSVVDSGTVRAVCGSSQPRAGWHFSPATARRPP